ncbi:hypothetical protein CRENBAI_019262 [Crenichthys baileyi]|uniref:Uncharacterized protein n=1 Tax=Crenichthys baileyi TaxID=28760 RepID=A0AAV9RQX3_9TELE
MISRIMSDYDSGDLAGFMTDLRPPSSSCAHRSVRLAYRLDGPFSLVSALASPRSPCLNPGYRHRVTQLLQLFLLRSSSCTPRFDVFFYSGHPTIFPASFISSMDSLQRSISSLTQLLWEFSSNSATLALPLLRSADPRPLPLKFTLAAPVLAHL